MKNLTIRNIISVCAGKYIGDEEILETEISEISTDSRKIKSGCLFAAIKGANVDGHCFVKASLEGGAACALCEHLPDGVEGGVILVDSTLKALQDIAKLYRSGFDIPLIGITGSVGKTTTKEMIFSVLGQKFNVHKTQGNFNNELGVPLTLFGLNSDSTAAVIEMGISGFGEMRRLTEMVRPQYAVITAIGHSHLEQLRDLQGVLKAKAEIFEGMDEQGVVFLNGDDPLLRELKLRQRTVFYGLYEKNDVRAQNVRTSIDGSTTCEILCDGRTVSVLIPAYGSHMVYAALAAAAVAFELGMSDIQIKAGIERYAGAAGRAEIIKTNSITIIDDCYNSNPTSVKNALVSLSALNGRKLAILGDMLELGGNSNRLHFEIGSFARKCGVTRVLTTGEFACDIAEGAGDIALCFDSKKSLISGLPYEIEKGDNVLVKASHGSAFEEIVEALKII